MTTITLANVTIEYANEGDVAFEPDRIAEVIVAPDPVAATRQMATATFINSDTVDVQYTGSVSAAIFTAGDFLDSNQPANPSAISQLASDTIRLTGWNNPIFQNDTLAYLGNAVGILRPQTINIG